MSVFSYKAVDQQQLSQEGTIVAGSARQARNQLRARGLRVRQLQQKNQNRTLWESFTMRRISSGKVSIAIRELATLLSVGVTVIDAIETIAKQHRRAFQTSLLLLKDRVEAGASLAEAMREQSGVFDELSVQMIEVGENSGNLDEVLAQLADFKDRYERLKDRVVGALLYPAIVLAASIGVTIFLMVVVVPMLLSSLLEAGRPLPWPTRVLQAMSTLLTTHGLTMMVLLASILTGFAILLRFPRPRRAWHHLLLRLPLVGQMIQKQTISRITMVISTLMRSGMVYLQAMEIAAKTSGNAVIRRALQKTEERINSGQNIGRALESTGVFPPVVIQVFSVGQETGRLEEMLDRLSSDYDQQVASLSTRLASVLVQCQLQQ